MNNINEDWALRLAHPLYDDFCREDESDNDYDEMEAGEARWELEDER